MTYLLALDPGARTGWALFHDLSGWHVAAAGVFSPTDPCIVPVKTLDFVVIENPVIYPNSRARPADILKLARIVGRYEERFASRTRHPVQLVEPRQWKGTIDGDIMVARIEAAMTEADRITLAGYRGGYRHNAVDAIGLGYWALRQPWCKRTVAA